MEDERIQQQKKYLIRVAYAVCHVLPIILLIKLAGAVLIPFVIALLIAVSLDAPVKKICATTNAGRNTASLIVVTIFYAIAALLCYGAFLCIFSGRMMEMFGNIYEEISTALAVGISWLNSFEYSDIFLEHAKTFTGEISSMAITKLSVMAASLPGIGVGVFVTVIATIFFEMELPRMVSFARLMLPEEACCRIESVAGETLPTLKGCVRAYIILFAMTYVELAAGLIILGIPGAMIISLIIALLDILPVLGTGTVLIPWSIIAFSTGRAATGAGVLILYVIISVVRNIAEPHLVGRQIGLSPAIMLPCMLVGLKIIGIAGLFIFPLAVAAALRFAVKTRTRG